MGLEFLFGSSALLVFAGFLMVAMTVSAMAFNKGCKLLGWHRLLRGYFGVLVAVVAVTVTSVEFPFDNFLSEMLLQSYFAFTWVAMFVTPLVLWLIPQGRPVLPDVMGAVGIWFFCSLLLWSLFLVIRY